MKRVQIKEPTIHKYDLISIQVSSASPIQEQLAPFNPTDKTSGYLVNSDGNIEFPVIGAVKAAGLTQVQLQNSIAEKVANYVKDPNIIVHFLQFKVNVLGEVKSPGLKTFEVDRVTIIDAISQAGDLTDNGKREDVAVIREEPTGRKLYKVDLRSGSLFQSPVYHLQSNDILYVGANEQKFKDLKSANNNTTLRSLQIFGTILGLFSSIVFAINAFK
jgi:polysaccharide export outer membrane protein